MLALVVEHTIGILGVAEQQLVTYVIVNCHQVLTLFSWGEAVIISMAELGHLTLPSKHYHKNEDWKGGFFCFHQYKGLTLTVPVTTIDALRHFETG